MVLVLGNSSDVEQRLSQFRGIVFAAPQVGGDRLNCGFGQHRSAQIEKLAFAVLGTDALQDHGFWPGQAGGDAGSPRPHGFSEQIDLVLRVGIIRKSAMWVSSEQTVGRWCQAVLVGLGGTQCPRSTWRQRWSG